MATTSKGTYASVNDLPPPVRVALKSMPQGEDIWRKAYNASVLDPKYKGNPKIPFSVAWAAVKDRYVQDASGNWHERAGWKPAAKTSHTEPATGVVTIEGVELVKAGNWASALSGRVPISPEHLDEMVLAARDAEVDSGPIKLGHVDPRFDGEPAFGWIRNVRRVGDSLVGDLADVPAKLAGIIKHAYPRRSVEINWGVKTPSGKNYKAALAGIALLGVTPPAVKGLADIISLYSGSSNEKDGTSTVDIIDGDNSDAAVAQASALSAMGTYAALLDGMETQPRAIAAMSLLAGTEQSSGVKEPADHQDVLNDTEVSVNDNEVRAALGLPDDLVVSDQLRKLAEDQKAAADAKVEADKVAADAKAAEDAKAAAAKAALPNDVTVTVDRAAFEELQRNAAAGARAATVLDDQEREGVLVAALSAGKITPASVEAYRNLWNSDKESTKTLLSGLPQVFSTTTQFSASPGTSGPQLDADGFSDSDWDSFYKGLDLGKVIDNG